MNDTTKQISEAITTETKKEETTRRRRKSSTQVGPLSIPTEYLRSDLRYRFVNYNPARIDKLYQLGYDPVRLRDRDHKDLARVVGDQTAASGSNKDGEFLVMTTETGAKMILVSTPIDLFEDGLREKAAAALELERIPAAKAQSDGLMNTTVTTTNGR